MAGGKTSQAHQRGRDGNVQGFGELEQFIGAARVNDAAADVEHGTLRSKYALESPFDLRLVGAQRWMIAGQSKFGRVYKCCFFRSDVFRNIDEDGARASGGREVEGFVHDGYDLLRVANHVVVLGAWTGDADGVHFLKSISA